MSDQHHFELELLSPEVSHCYQLVMRVSLMGRWEHQPQNFVWLCTPVGLWKGSSNSTANGLFGRLQEQNDLFIVGSHDTEYQEQKEIMEFEIQYSVPYFDIVNDITTAGIELDFSVVETETTGHLSPSELHHAPHEPLDIGDYPPFVPSNYSPIGQINPDIFVPFALGYIIIGGLIAARHPGNAIGWLLLGGLLIISANDFIYWYAKTI